MRNPNRIPKFCAKLAELWAKNCPDWRFGQFISNVFGEFHARGIDPWFFEEDRMIEELEKLFKEEKE